MPAKIYLMKALLIMNHAPDYRESFLRELAKQLDLTVLAQPCLPDGLTPPDSRGNYKYVELPSKKFPGFQWQSGLQDIISSEAYDIICCNFNPRHPHWIWFFLRNKSVHKQWIWWGPIHGKSRLLPIRFLKRLLLPRAAACLVYNEPIAQQLREQYGIDAFSFNNTEVEDSEFREGVYDDHPEIRLLFVGRWQRRKRLERLVELAARRPDVHIRLVGPDMDKLSIPQILRGSERLTVFCRTTGSDLNPHFDWADLVANPGHAGLLVMNAARHGKAIVLDADSKHAPEYWLAKEAKQPFISFGNQQVVDDFLDKLIYEKSQLQEWGRTLQTVAKEKYSVEHMVAAHLVLFESVASNRPPKNK